MGVIGNFVIVPRELMQNQWYTHSPTIHLYLHCLLRANYVNSEWHGITIERGQFVTSLNTLSRETGLSIKQIRSALDRLKRANYVASKPTNKYRIITVLNYDLMQQAASERASKGQTKGKQRATDNKENKEKNISSSTSVDAQPLFDYQSVIDSFNSVCKSLPKVLKLTEKRRKAIKNAKRQLGEMSFDDFFAKVEQADFLTGRSGTWSCGFDWILKPSNLTKIIEGNYDNKPKQDEMKHLLEGYNR